MPKVTQINQNSSGSSRQFNNYEIGRVSGVSNNVGANNGNFTSQAGSFLPANARRSLAGLLPGGRAVPKAFTQGPSVQFNTSDDADNDWRVRVSISPNSKILYWDPNASGNVPGLLAPLRSTDGFIFPYVPSVTVSHTANYTSVPLTHSNYMQYFYESSSVASININGDFTVQNIEEGKYFLAALYFFRACTKMFYGKSSEYQGSPPPIVYLDGYGQHYLPHVPCVVTNFSHTMPSEVDYVEVRTPQSVTTKTTSSTLTGTYGSITLPQVTGASITDKSITSQTVNTAFNRVPTISTFNLTLQPIISRNQAIDFDYAEFARGGLIAGKNNPYPGGYL
jgi:hypothetical protein